MKYMVMSFEDDSDFSARTDDAEKTQYWADWRAYFGACQQAGIMAYPGNVLGPGSTARTIKDNAVAGGSQTNLLAHLSGYWVIDVPTMDEAVEWTGRCPAAAHGAVEIRPVFQP